MFFLMVGVQLVDVATWANNPLAFVTSTLRNIKRARSYASAHVLAASQSIARMKQLKVVAVNFDKTRIGVTSERPNTEMSRPRTKYITFQSLTTIRDTGRITTTTYGCEQSRGRDHHKYGNNGPALHDRRSVCRWECWPHSSSPNVET